MSQTRGNLQKKVLLNFVLSKAKISINEKTIKEDENKNGLSWGEGFTREPFEQN